MIDILKVVAVLAAIAYLNKKVKTKVSTANYWTMNTGLFLLLFASTLDFSDGIRAWNHVPIIGQRAPFHDILEDQFGDLPGFSLFAIGAFRAIMEKANSDSPQAV